MFRLESEVNTLVIKLVQGNYNITRWNYNLLNNIYFYLVCYLRNVASTQWISHTLGKQKKNAFGPEEETLMAMSNTTEVSRYTFDTLFLHICLLQGHLRFDLYLLGSFDKASLAMNVPRFSNSVFGSLAHSCLDKTNRIRVLREFGNTFYQ